MSPVRHTGISKITLETGVRRSNKNKMSNGMSKTILIILFMGMLTFGYYALVFEPNNIKIERQVVAIENLPQTFDGVKIAQLSDLHSLWFGSQEKRILEILEELKPDFVFITGDFVDPTTKITKGVESVTKLWGELGNEYKNRIFGVFGNHDTPLVRNLLKRSGITILENENKKIFINNEFIYLIGVDDPWTGRHNLAKAMEGIETEAPKILLSHSPDIIEEIKKEKIDIDLILAGHTHGGQVRIPFLGAPWTPSKYGQKYAQGLFEINSTYLYVNRGIGTSLLPIRFNCPPEITLIKLQK